MNKSYIFGLIAAIVLSAFPQVAHANLLSNSGFEDWVMYEGKEVPADWIHVFNYNSPVGTKESTVVKSGSYSGKIEVTDLFKSQWGGWFQEKPFIGGRTLYAYQPLNIPFSLIFTVATLQIQFKDRNGTVIGSANRIQRSTATTDWEALSWTGTAPINTAKFEYGVILESWGSGPFQCTVYFDDAYADNVPIPEPISLLLLGTGLIGMLAVTRQEVLWL